MNGKSNPTPLPFGGYGAQSLFTPECAPGDVVESAPLARFGLYFDGHVAKPPLVQLRPSPDELSVDSHDDLNRAHDDDPELNDEPRSDDDNQTTHSFVRGSQPGGGRGDRAEKDDLRRQDKFDREVGRARAQRERFERSRHRGALGGISRRRRANGGPRFVDAQRGRTSTSATAVPERERSGRRSDRDLGHPTLSTAAHLSECRGVADVATHPNALTRFATGPLHGSALGLYFVLLPYVVLSKWRLAAHQSSGSLIRVLLVGLALFWLVFLIQLVRNVLHLRRGLLIGGGGSAWLASLVVATLPFLVSAAAITMGDHQASANAVPTNTAFDSARARATALADEKPGRTPARHSLGPNGPPDLPSSASTMGAVPLALMAKRRADLLRQQQFELNDAQMDDTVELLRSSNPTLIARVRAQLGDQLDGVVALSLEHHYSTLATTTDPVVVCVVSDDDDGVVLSFAREGGRLSLPAHWSDHEIIEAAVVLGDGNRVAFATEEYGLLRALATRSLRRTVVVYLGAARDLDDGLQVCSVTVAPVVGELRAQTWSGGRIESALPTRHADPSRDPNSLEPGEVRVEMLRAAPRVVGLHEPFAPTLRRRCVEMVAYLALHRHEPVTGERLRTRVLTYAEVDATTRTLANTASAVRRSLGVDAKGPLLHPVTSSGLYVTHGVSSDVEIFHALVARARQLPLDQGAPLARRALCLVQGEPLASALRGFEWFLVEGHLARLLRDGEWAALALHQHAMENGEYEVAFWSLAQGRLIDPYSDALSDALSRVPRLRQFRGDGASRAQDQPVGATGAVAVGGSLERLGD